MNYRFDIFNFVGYFVSIRTFFLSFQKSKIEIFIRFKILDERNMRDIW